ncbi:MAG: RIP metalloprotease RseP [Candidatus Gracilibacteria bacterium]
MLSYLITAIIFVLIFSILVLIHELGHFTMAKKAGIKVEEFGFGLPPRMFGKKVGETIYSLNWIPFGGFVRMLGEDSKKASMLKNKRSFIAQPMRSRALVIVAGVVMNFFLAWILLTIGFSFGMKPLLLPDEVFTAIDQGQIVLQEGLKIKSIEEGSFFERVGLKKDDVITSFNGEEITADIAEGMLKNPVGTYDVLRDGKIYNFNTVAKDVPAKFDPTYFKAEFYEAVAFPRVGFFEVKEGNSYYLAGVRKGDELLTINGSQVYGINDFERLVRGEQKIEMVVYRDGLRKEISMELPQKRQVVVEQILADMPGAKAGIKANDIILAVNGEKFTDVEKLIAYTKQFEGKELKYLVERDGKPMTLLVTINSDGQMGAFLSELMTYAGSPGITLYNSDVYSSIQEVKDVQYPFYVAAYKSFEEMWKLSKVTATMFIDVIGDILSSGSVPDSVAGPVGIAGMTHVVVQEGFVSVLRFIALLSLSLGVINILPIPALDGGRLLFIVVEFIIGRKVNQKLESYIHLVSYFLILLLILMVTYSDVAKLFVK